MHKTVLSTADVARLFNVTETTVKRWADEGMLRCQKTPGGHRRFPVRLVIEFAEQNRFEPGGVLEFPTNDAINSKTEMATLARDFGTLTQIFVDRALSANRNDLFLFLSFLYEHCFQLWEIHDLILRPGMAEIGERWSNGDIGIGHEHRASYETLDALARLQAEIMVKPPVGKVALFASIGEELHEIGLRCASYIFESEGWTTQYLGAAVPTEAVIESINDAKPAVVCLSFTRREQVQDSLQALDEVAAAARGVGAMLITGGRSAEELHTFRSLFDGVFTSSHQVQAFIEHIQPQGSEAPCKELRQDS